jgi:hypothetical protein
MSTIPLKAKPAPAAAQVGAVRTGRLADRLVATALAAGVIALAVPVTAWGPCFDDAGELQTAAAVLGIAHPPGYPGYILLGHLICLIPFFEPAALISGANLLAGATCMSLLYLLQRRLEVHPLAAVLSTAAVALHDRYWMTITAPEVYAPSLLLLCLAVYGAVGWARGGTRVGLIGAAVCTGLLMINRPPEVLSAAMLLLFVVLVAGRRNPRRGELARCLWSVTVAAAIPILICSAYVMWRDTPRTPYNYLDNYNRHIAPIVDRESPVPERVQRWYWLASARQYRDAQVDSWRKFLVRLDYLRDEFGYRGPVGFCVGLGVVAIGTVRLLRRDTKAALLVAGLILSNASFYCLYVTFGTEAYILPALALVGCLAGQGLTRLFERVRYRPAAVTFLACAAGLCVYLCSDEDWRQSSSFLEARSFLAAGSVIMGLYHRVIPLQYDVLVRWKREDLKAFAISSQGAAEQVLRWPDRPVYFVDAHRVPPGYRLVAEGNLYRVLRAEAPEPGPHPDPTDS